MQSGQLEKNLFQSVYCILELTYVLLLTFKLTVFSFIFCYICGIDQACHNVFNRMKLDRMMKRKMPVGIYSSERTCSSMFLFTRRRSTHETMIVHVADRCSRKWSLVSHDSNFHPFYFCSIFPTLLEPHGTGLFRLEGILGVLLGQKTTASYPLISLQSPCPI